MRCPVTILGVTCDAEIRDGEGQLVGEGDGRMWVVCAPCALRGVRAADVEHAEPALDLS